MNRLVNLLIGVAGMGVISTNSLSHALFDEEGRTAAPVYVVGGKMPTKEDGDVTAKKMWRKSDWSKKGVSYGIDLNRDGNTDLNVFYVECIDKELGPFGAYYFPTYQLILDNGTNDGKSMDGIIDNVIDYKGGLIENDAPDCPEKMKQLELDLGGREY